MSTSERVGHPGLSFFADELLHVWECPHILRLPGGNPDFIRCGHLSHGPGICPFDHGEDVPLLEIKALVLCSDCEETIQRRDCRGSDGRLICGQCAMGEISGSAA